jgi:hypothetical protein
MPGELKVYEGDKRKPLKESIGKAKLDAHGKEPL